MESTNTRFDLPGYSIPLNYIDADEMFPNALGNYSTERLNTHREILMMRALNSITDKSDWEKKVFDEEITTKWRKEIMDTGDDITPTMIDWIIKEAQWKAEVFRDTKRVVAFDAGVVKSDTAITKDLRQALKEAVRPLEDVPEEFKDYHPGSDDKVVDLVHPSLFPVVYGRTRVLHRKLIGLEDFENSIGEGKVLAVPTEEETTTVDDDDDDDDDDDQWSSRNITHQPYSRKFQWLPCDVHFTDTSECRIASYINNLHPKQHGPLYQVIEKILAQTIPLWNMTLTLVQDHYSRIPYDKIEYDEHPEAEPQAANEEEEWSEEYNERWERWRQREPIRRPEPGKFTPHVIGAEGQVNLCEDFARNGLQVIVKLANIELTPDKPEYNGGSWHIEGQLNEHICATAIYYYDSENITENRLAFRQRAARRIISDMPYEQSRHEFLQAIFGLDSKSAYTKSNITQVLGSVDTRQGRLLTFPNSLQHRVSPFTLADRTKPGHRKILAFFLVDPHLSIISSGNVPPQQESWWKERQEVVGKLLNERLPLELQNMVKKDIDATPITMEEARQYRQELMKERSSKSKAQNRDFETGNFNLCEH
ncbi:hypothetical protein BDV32DRAFT_141025 [Aspergillus pseudonomiae]|uniref:Uncharacterized protein n=1 Tax=Aspergillus pseudonomiae TaxID=1506151 RepID=A0A5N6HTH9_9EURO|nr:uncharacterized protein BDV37DRAFT_252607 [Aspergillus pseudonomiae]KAB8256690.1 hypothetical protein BDV32DRAFT_141025 [Aspergillus pseudonomiae]KAE8402299.1 hypothetical protein BDV37DRAFT_252607 [Aspergillus pseudonomiae]